jgi:uracil-DNA glycosylase
MQTVRPDGPMPARIMICGEAPGQEEERLGVPFVGASGQELSRMLHEAGIARSECFITNVCRVRPPNNDIENFIALKKKDVTLVHVTMRDKYVLPIVQEGAKMLEFEIEQCKPKVIIACGDVALWALTGAWGVKKWRGSELKHSSGAIVIPIWHPAAVLRMWELRAETVNDLKRAKRVLEFGSIKPEWNFAIRPSFQTVTTLIKDLLERASKGIIWVDFDLETKCGHIDCAGISWSALEALCIPLMSKTNFSGYWNLEEEAFIVFLLYKLLTNKNVYVRGQNLLYDAQYTYRHWHFIPNVKQDTMISQHSCFSGMRKSLDFQASLYCHWYVQWKPDKSAWKEGG